VMSPPGQAHLLPAELVRQSQLEEIMEAKTPPYSFATDTAFQRNLAQAILTGRVPLAECGPPAKDGKTYAWEFRLACSVRNVCQKMDVVLLGIEQDRPAAKEQAVPF